MQSEFFDKKIREAADHHHPAYDEQAWGKMEKLLNKHLPQKDENKRRFLFIILLFLLIGGGVGMMIWQPWKSSGSQPTADGKHSTVDTRQPKVDNVQANEVQTKQPVNDQPTATPDPNSAENNPQPAHIETTQQDKIEVVKDRPAEPARINNRASVPGKPGNVIPGKRKKDPLREALIARNDREKKPTVNPTPEETSIVTNKQNSTGVPSESVKSATQPAEADSKPVTPVITPGTTPTEKTKVKETENVKKDPVSTNTASKKKEKAPRKPIPFFISVSAGPDLSFTDKTRKGDTKLLAGFGLGYTFKDRLTIRSGFYSGRKVYSAKPEEYNPPPDFWTWYPYLENVDANCKIVEIPVIATYEFGKSAKNRWMASAGLSSYVMKEETYDYRYKYSPTSPSYNMKYTIKDENKHMFSVLTLSGGYKRNLGDRVFVSAEPYLKVPLAGVGYGKVKLNSAGVQFSVGVKPFSKKLKTQAPK